MTDDLTALASTRLQAIRVMCFAFVGMLPILALVLVVVFGLGGTEWGLPEVAGAMLVLNLLAFVVAEVIGYTAAAIPAGTAPDAGFRAGLDALQSTTIRRLAITEAPAMLGVVASVMAESAWPFLLSALWAAMSMTWHGWPHRRSISRLQRNLEREGGHSGLLRVLDGTPTIQQF